MKKMLFIVNPKAGRTTLKNCLIDVIDVFCKKEYEVRIYLTQGVGDAARVVKEEGEKYDVSYVPEVTELLVIRLQDLWNVD